MTRILNHLRLAVVAIALTFAETSMALAETAFLEVTSKVDPANRAAAAEVYAKFKPVFLENIPGAQSKALLVRDKDVQVLHGFAWVADAQACLASDIFRKDVVGALAPLSAADPEICIYLGP